MKVIKPMLAHPAGKKEIDYGNTVFVQPKLDGVRCVFTKNGAFSRTGKQFKNVDHIERGLRGFFKKYPDIVLDGELYNHKLKNDFEKIISLVRKTKPTLAHKHEASKLVEYHLYDFINDLNYENRIRFIEGLFRSGNAYAHPSIKVVTTHYVEQESNARIFHDEFLSQGYEGTIIRLNKPYECKRSYNLQKFKDFEDAEATIVGYELGKGKRKGTIGKFLMQDDDGNKFGCPPGKGYNYSQMATMLNNIHLYMGQRATFTFFGRTKAESYRHPSFKGIRNYE